MRFPFGRLPEGLITSGVVYTGVGMEEKKDELIFVRHMEELAKSAYYKGINVYTDFLGLAERSLFYRIRKAELSVPYSVYGGFPDAERVKIGFHGGLEGNGEILPDAFLDDYPICVVKICPANAKFAENLTHRDYLGAILNLGIDRSTTGDILLAEDAVYLSCDPMIGSFLCENLTRIRHTTVRAAVEGRMQMPFDRSYETLHANVASLRLDAVIGAAFHTSRSSIAGLIPGGRVFVNGREILQGSYMLKDGDIVSVRGYGKFRYVSQGNMTKKGRFNITLEKYI